MSTIEVAVAGRGIQVKQGYEKPSAGDVNTCEVSIAIESGGVWDSLPNKRVTFATRTASVTVDYAPTITVPHEVMSSPGALYLTLTGYDANGIEVARTHRMTYPIEVAKAGADEGSEPSPATLDVVSRIDNLASTLEASETTRQEAFERAQNERSSAFQASMSEWKQDVAESVSQASIATEKANIATSDANNAATNANEAAVNANNAAAQVTAQYAEDKQAWNAEVSAAAGEARAAGAEVKADYEQNVVSDYERRTAEWQSQLDEKATKDELAATIHKQEATDLMQDKRIENLEAAAKGVLYREDVDTTEAYTKTVPTGAQKWASLDKVGGKTVVWNQLVSEYQNGRIYGVLITLNDGNTSVDIVGTLSSTPEYNQLAVTKQNITFRRNGATKYLVTMSKAPGTPWGISGYSEKATGSETSFIWTPPSSDTDWTGYVYLKTREGDTLNIQDLSVNVYNLTAMFGAGNEPSTVNEFRAMFPADYYPYNPGELMSAEVVEVVSKGTFLIPAEVREMCPGYGWSAGTVCNEIDFERKVYVQRVGSVDMGTLDWGYGSSLFGAKFNIKPASTLDARKDGLICDKYQADKQISISFESMTDKTMLRYSDGTLFVKDEAYTDSVSFKAAMAGVQLYYELANPVEVDLSNVLPDDHFIEVEAGGTVTFKQASTQLPVPSSITYQISTSEVIANA